MLRGAGVIFFAYIGFDAVSTAAQEAKNPKRDMPIGILGSLVVCTVLYILVALVLTGLVNYRYLGAGLAGRGHRCDRGEVGEPAGEAGRAGRADQHHGGDAAGAEPRVLLDVEGWSAAQDVLRGASEVPHAVDLSITVGLVVAVFASTIPLDKLGEMTSIGTLLAFIIVCAGVMALRRRSPELPRPFHAPFSPRRRSWAS